MDLWTTGFVSLLLLACAAALLFSHARTWRHAVACAATREELDYRRRQFRRRTQTSALMAVLALALFAGQWLTHAIDSRWFAIAYWLAVLIVVGWVCLLALADILATKFHYDRVRDGYVVERAKLEAEIRRIQNTGNNGRRDNDGDESD